MDSLIDVSPEHTLKCLGLEATLHNQTRLPIHGPTGSQLSQEELLNMLWLPANRAPEVCQHKIAAGSGMHKVPRNSGALPDGGHILQLQRKLQQQTLAVSPLPTCSLSCTAPCS